MKPTAAEPVPGDAPKGLFELEHRFTYHVPRTDQVPKYGMIRDTGLDVAQLLVELCPDNRELALALTKLDEVVFWANAAIARGERCNGR